MHSQILNIYKLITGKWFTRITIVSYSALMHQISLFLWNAWVSSWTTFPFDQLNRVQRIQYFSPWSQKLEKNVNGFLLLWRHYFMLIFKKLYKSKRLSSATLDLMQQTKKNLDQHYSKFFSFQKFFIQTYIRTVNFLNNYCLTCQFILKEIMLRFLECIF